MKRNDSVLSIVLPKEVLKKLEDNRKKTGLGVSPFIRSLVMKWVEEEKRNEK